ncbi:aspartyl protease family protein [Stakelama marina]|uniref:Aspartyl protease family protein n=1 Tax=Stakelama marina TaxID=2826939 RepID=A0A8T4IFG7_9SPHN|nr:aspartyl protease family protein [Stakelama marina]MBR0553300.1 aspartyl protease family protein [Stakelama marina]
MPATHSGDGSASARPSPELRQMLSDAALLTLGENQRRMTVPVSINGEGPYPFVIDTGAERTVISRQLATVLGLKSGPRVTLAAMSGRQVVGTYVVPELSVERLSDFAGLAAPGLDKYDLGAHGLLGLDVLEGHLIRFDFARREMSVRDSPRRRVLRHSSDEIVVTARRYHHRLVLTDAEYRGHAIRVLIDTGSVISVGNPAFQRLVERSRSIANPLTVLSVTGDRVEAQLSLVDGVKIGSVRYKSLPVAFSPQPPFDTFAPGDRPVLILGMDALRIFSQVDIDFTNSRIVFHMPDPDYVPPVWW